MTVVLPVAAVCASGAGGGANEPLRDGVARVVESRLRRLGGARRSRVRATGRCGGPSVRRTQPEWLFDGLRDRRRDGRPHLRRTVVSGAAADPAERQRGLGACTRARRRAGVHVDRRGPLRPTPAVYRSGRLVLRAPVGVGSPSTPTPRGASTSTSDSFPRCGGPVRARRARHLGGFDRAGSLERLHQAARRHARARVRSSRPRDPGRRPAVGRGASAPERVG